MLNLFRALIVFVAAAIGLAFGYLNFESTTVDLFFGQPRAPLVVFLAIAFVLGFLIALLVCSIRLMRSRRRLSHTRRKLKDARAELAHLRSLPIHDA